MAEEYFWTKPNEKLDDLLDGRTVFYSVDRPMNEVAVTGKVVFVQPADDFWGEGEDYRSEVVENPTWLEVAVMADKMIHTTGDHHHSFLENVYEDTRIEVEDGVRAMRFSMGS